MKIGLIGPGNMGRAIITGLANKFPAGDIFVKAHHLNPSFEKFQKQVGFQLADHDNLLKVGALFVTTPAPVTISALKNLELSPDTIIISAAQGVSAADIKQIFPNNPVFCIIPNIPVAVNAGCIAIAKSDEGEGATKTVMELLKSLGTVIPVPSDQLGIVGTIGGCGPAFVDVFLDALSDVGVANGMSRDTANQVSEAMVSGSGKMALNSNLTPAGLKDLVTSPGGSTIKGVLALDANGFRKAVARAVNKANGTD